jgi:hypothetical protein
VPARTVCPRRVLRRNALSREALRNRDRTVAGARLREVFRYQASIGSRESVGAVEIAVYRASGSLEGSCFLWLVASKKRVALWFAWTEFNFQCCKMDHRIQNHMIHSGKCDTQSGQFWGASGGCCNSGAPRRGCSPALTSIRDGRCIKLRVAAVHATACRVPTGRATTRGRSRRRSRRHRRPSSSSSSSAPCHATTTPAAQRWARSIETIIL